MIGQMPLVRNGEQGLIRGDDAAPAGAFVAWYNPPREREVHQKGVSKW
jgi:hypothetical protein